MLKKLSKKAGARLVIHDPNSPPLPDEYGLDLQPNTASSISIQRVSNTLNGIEYVYKFHMLIFSKTASDNTIRTSVRS